MSAIEVKNLVKKFHGQTVLHGIDLNVQEGEVVAIIGPSGSGKTTLLRSINLLEQPESGTIRVGDVTIDTARSFSQQKGLIRRLRQHVGFVFQSFNLFPHRTVLENIIEGPVIVKGEDKNESIVRARELLAKVGLNGKENSYPRRLSGGQQQRVACARAIMARPSVIFADEPTGNLDSRSSREVLGFLRNSVRDYGQSIVMVTHDPRAASFADRVLVLADGNITRDMQHPTYNEILEVFAGDDDIDDVPAADMVAPSTATEGAQA